MRPSPARRTNTSLPRGELADVERVAWVAARNDLIYIYYPRLNSTFDENKPWAYENPNRVTEGINVLFGDGHVSYLTRSAAAALLGFS
jgi:prepilin-type processing-associated H-X9-DG protein